MKIVLNVDNNIGPGGQPLDDFLMDVTDATSVEVIHEEMPGPIPWEKPRPEFSDEELEHILNFIGYHRDVLSGREAGAADALTEPIEARIRAHLGE